MPQHLPLPTGPFAVGAIDVMLDYTKEAPFFRLYYPSTEQAKSADNKNLQNNWFCWLPDESYFNGIAKVLMLYKIFLKIAFWWSDKIKIPALYGSKPKTDKSLKCVIMSHGLGGCRFLYSNICCELASRGILVAALEHRDNSACYTFYYKNMSDAMQDKKTAIQFEHIKLGKEHYTKRNKQLKIKSEECCKVFDFLKDVNQGIEIKNILDYVPFHKNQNIQFNLKQLMGKLDLTKTTMMGHSFGGSTALYTLSKRKDFNLGILLDPWMFPIKNEQIIEKITQPLLFINTQTFHISANINAMVDYLNLENTQMFTIKHTTHENQTDSVLLIGYWLNWFMKKLDPLLALQINNALIFKFFHQHHDHHSLIEQSTDDNEEFASFCSILEKEAENIDEGLTKPWA